MRYNNMASTIWSVADLLRGSYRQSEYGRVIFLEVIYAELRELSKEIVELLGDGI